MSTEVEAVNTEAVEQTQPVADLAAEKLSGIKEVAKNEEVMAIAQDKVAVGKVAEKPAAKPSFFVKKTARHTISVDVLTSKDDGRIVSVSRTGLGIDFGKDFSYMVHTKLDFFFSMPNYEDMSTYRQRSSVYRKEVQQMMVDKLSIRNFLLVWHLKDWNMTDEAGNKIVLTFDHNGTLSDESTAAVYALSPTLMDVVMTVLEKDLLL